jgi:hypothetical protein
MALTSFAQVQAFFTQVLTQNQQINDVPNAPHGPFWTTMSYHDFTTGNVPDVDPPTKILLVGNSAASNIILALQGVGPLFGPTGGIGQMPADGPPFFTAPQIAEILDVRNDPLTKWRSAVTKLGRERPYERRPVSGQPRSRH